MKTKYEIAILALIIGMVLGLPAVADTHKILYSYNYTSNISIVYDQLNQTNSSKSNTTLGALQIIPMPTNATANITAIYNNSFWVYSNNGTLMFKNNTGISRMVNLT